MILLKSSKECLNRVCTFILEEYLNGNKRSLTSTSQLLLGLIHFDLEYFEKSLNYYKESFPNKKHLYESLVHDFPKLYNEYAKGEFKSRVENFLNEITICN